MSQGDYTDPTALLAGTWGKNRKVKARVFSKNQTERYFQEVEIRLRSTLTPHRCTGYEVFWQVLEDPECLRRNRQVERESRGLDLSEETQRRAIWGQGRGPCGGDHHRQRHQGIRQRCRGDLRDGQHLRRGQSGDGLQLRRRAERRRLWVHVVRGRYLRRVSRPGRRPIWSGGSACALETSGRAVSALSGVKDTPILSSPRMPSRTFTPSLTRSCTSSPISGRVTRDCRGRARKSSGTPRPALAWGLDEQDYVLSGEISPPWPRLRRGPGVPAAAFGFRVLARVEDQAGVLPCADHPGRGLPGLERRRSVPLRACDRLRHRLRHGPVVCHSTPARLCAPPAAVPRGSVFPSPACQIDILSPGGGSPAACHAPAERRPGAIASGNVSCSPQCLPDREDLHRLDGEKSFEGAAPGSLPGSGPSPRRPGRGC